MISEEKLLLPRQVDVTKKQVNEDNQVNGDMLNTLKPAVPHCGKGHSLEAVKKNIQKSPMFISIDDLHPFEGMLISEKWKMLENIDNRTTCEVCKKSRKYFCYSCFIPLPGLENCVPKVKLPLKVDIIKHAREKNGKSTASHAAVLASDDVTIYTYPNIPNYNQEQNVVLIYPGKNALSTEEIIQEFKQKTEKTNSTGIKFNDTWEDTYIARAVFIDSTWNQSHGIYKDSRLQALPCLVLRSRISQFWRYQCGSPRWYLSTIESIHQFFIELISILRSRYWKQTNKNYETNAGNNTSGIIDSAVDPNEDKSESKRTEYIVGTIDTITQFYYGEFDNLLFFFRFMYNKIHTLYKHEDLLSYKRSLN